MIPVVGDSPLEILLLRTTRRYCRLGGQKILRGVINRIWVSMGFINIK